MGEKQEEYSEKEKVLAYHMNMLYDAKILKKEMRQDPDSNRLGSQIPFYFIHYQGWKVRYDEWVPASRLLKATPENKLLKEQIKESYKAKKKPKDKKKSKKEKAADKNTNNNSNNGNNINNSNNGNNNSNDKRQRYPATTKLSPAESGKLFDFPLLLKKQLVLDWDQINNKKQLPELPRQQTVASVLQDYKKYKETETKISVIISPPSSPTRSKRKRTVVQSSSGKFQAEIIDSLQVYFDKCLGLLLLYRFERPQYATLLQGESLVNGASTIYRPEHLLRLLVKLPVLLQDEDLEPQVALDIAAHASDLLSFLNNNFANYFESASAYTPVAPSYIRMV